MANIKYQKGKVEGLSNKIRESVDIHLADKAAEYDSILRILSISKGDEVNSLLQQLIAEREAIITLAEFYKKMLEMLKKASNDVDQIESHYGNSHMSGGGGA